MKTETRPCLLCGASMVLAIAEPGEEPHWAECTACDCMYDGYDVRLRLEGNLKGFTVKFDTVDDTRHWLRAVVTECPEAREIVEKAMANGR